MDATKDKKPQQEGGGLQFGVTLSGRCTGAGSRGPGQGAAPSPGTVAAAARSGFRLLAPPAGSSSFIFLWSLANATQRLLSLSLKRTQEHGAVSSVGQKWDFLLCFSLPAPRAPDRALSHWSGDDNSATSWGLRKTTGTSSHAARGRAPGS